MADRIVVALTGSTGQIYGLRALEMVQNTGYEAHLVVSDAAKINIKQETDRDIDEIRARADRTYDIKNIAAPLASGSFRTQGMIVVPCSMKTLSNIACGNSGNLITRAADVTLKERRPLVVMPREKPFNRIHLENMLDVTDAGGIIMPPFPSFYHNPESIDEIVDRTVARALSLLDVPVEFEEWRGLTGSSEAVAGDR